LVTLAAARAGSDAIVTRTFNLVGPGEPTSLVCGAFASQIAAREAGLEQGPLTVGNLDSQRDFLDVRDAVRAYVLAATRGSAGAVYNVCRGEPARISDVLRILIAQARTPIDVRPSTGATATDVPVQFGDPGRLVAATGWTPAFTLAQSLEALLEWQRAALERGDATGVTARDETR
jgi:GDP-4-dehydro-6-deoxy-D-mannose reductase